MQQIRVIIVYMQQITFPYAGVRNDNIHHLQQNNIQRKVQKYISFSFR